MYFHLRDSVNWHRFAVYPKLGRYALVKSQNDRLRLLKEGDLGWPPGRWRRLEITCLGSGLSVEVEGETVLTLRDEGTALRTGQVAIAATRENEAQAVVEVDNVEVRRSVESAVAADTR